jgi:hypothetical protein
MMTSLALLAWPLLTFVFGFFPISLALMGKADVPMALRAGVVPGIFGSIMAFVFWTEFSNPVFLIVGTILGAAATAFLIVGISGFIFKAECLSCVAWVVNFTGIILLILGAYVMYAFSGYLVYLTEGMVAGLAVFLFGIAALAAGLSVLGKMKGAWVIMAVVVINFIICFYLLLYP